MHATCAPCAKFSREQFMTHTERFVLTSVNLTRTSFALVTDISIYFLSDRCKCRFTCFLLVKTTDVIASLVFFVFLFLLQLFYLYCSVSFFLRLCLFSCPSLRFSCAFYLFNFKWLAYCSPVSREEIESRLHVERKEETRKTSYELNEMEISEWLSHSPFIYLSNNLMCLVR